MKRKVSLSQEDSKVEVKGFEARHYDTLMNLITLGWYPSFLRRVVADLELRPGERILDMGAGTGRNALLFWEAMQGRGEIVGLEIGPEMQAQFLRKSAGIDSIRLEDRRIDEALPFEGEFDRVFISFVLHGFVQERRDRIIENAFRALRPGGKFCILDYANFQVDNAPWWVRLAIRKVECPLAEEFIERDTKEMLRAKGFEGFKETKYLKGHLRLLQAFKG